MEEKSFFASLDQEPWLTLSTWADWLADNNQPDKEKVVRWLIKWQRKPEQRVIKDRATGKITFGYFWYPLYLGNFKPSQIVLNSRSSPHAIPYFSRTMSLVRGVFSTVHSAYQVLVEALLPYIDKLD